MPNNVRKARNLAIRLSFFEILCCVLSFGFYGIRRAKIILVFLFLNCIFTAIGYTAKLRLSICGLLMNGCYCISVIGGFYVYVMIDFLIRGGWDRENINHGSTDIKNNTGISMWGSLLLTSMPIAALFLIGLHTCYLALILDEELDLRKQNNPRPSRDNDFRQLPKAPKLSKKRAKAIAKENEHTIEVLDLSGLNQDDPACVICLDRQKDSAFYPCGH